jgi:Zn-dependent M28 family amino/carboxypeptidase
MGNPGQRIPYVVAVLTIAACSEAPDSGLSSSSEAPDSSELGSLSPNSPFSEDVLNAATTIEPGYIRDIIAELASDRYQGRGPGSDGDRLTLSFLADELDAIGFAPGGPGGSWEQPFDLIGVNATQPAEWVFASEDAAVTLTQGDEFIVASGVQSSRAVVEDAELVFVGYGIEAPEYDWDDYKGADLTGKVLVMLNNDPDWDPDLFEGETRLYYGRWTYKYESAARQGAAGAIIVHTDASAGYPWQVVQTSWTGEQFELPAGDEPRMQLAGWVTESAAAELIALAGEDLEQLVDAARQPDFEPVPLGVRTSLELDIAISQTGTANVLGFLEGSDPELADEVVVYTAHHDHLGIGAASANGDPDDRIYNGALDNASGVAAVLAIGRAFTYLPERPRRSVLLAFVGAEEQGLLGSEFYARNPTVPPGRIAANINLDGANIWGLTRDIAFIGYGKSTLDEVAETVAGYQDRVVKPDQFPDRGFFYRSDQFNFAKIGVPAMFADSGTDFIGRPEGWGEERINEYTDVNYHQPSDELTDEWNFEGTVQDAEFAFLTGVMIANADEMPSWRPGDEFEAVRLEALATVE